MTKQVQAERSWKARPWGARLVHGLAVLAPVSAGAATAVVLGSRLPASSTVTGVVLRILFVVAASTAMVLGVDRVSRRLLPLAALYRLSLVFPDHAPSRFRAALKAGSSRRVARMVAHTRQHGLPHDPGEAAGRVVELISAIGDHDRRTRGHSERVRLYADLIGEEMHLPKGDRQKLQWAALLHDLGKLMVPAEILNKKGAPTDKEWAVLRTHPAQGERLVAPLRSFLGSWADAVGGHHEWWNGKGYPRGLQGSQITAGAAIVAVADAYEVMTAVRSYKRPMPATAARAELTRSAGVQFSPDVVRAFLCVSLGKLRLAAGPAASLAQIPFLGTAAQFPATVGTALQGASSVAAAAAPGVAASVIAATAVVASPATTAGAQRTARPAIAHLDAKQSPTDATTTSRPTAPNSASPDRADPARPNANSNSGGSGTTVPDPGESTTTIPDASGIEITIPPIIRTGTPTTTVVRAATTSTIPGTVGSGTTIPHTAGGTTKSVTSTTTAVTPVSLP